MPGGMTTRNHVWSGIVLVIVVGLLMGVYFLWMGNEAANDPGPTLLITADANASSASSETFVNYANEDYGFSVQYPDNWTVSTETTGEGTNAISSVLLRGTSEGVTISILPTSLEGVVRNSIAIISETEVDVNGIIAQKLIGTNAKDGSEYSVILITTDEQLYSISGGGQILDDVVSYFELR